MSIVPVDRAMQHSIAFVRVRNQIEIMKGQKAIGE